MKPDFGAGLFLGAVIAFATAWLIGWGPSEQWAALLAGLMALIGTLIAGWLAWAGVQRQIKAQAEADEARRRARLDAERAMLPHALSIIESLCEEQIDSNISGPPLSPTSLPVLPAEVVETIKSCIEFERSSGAAPSEAALKLSDLLGLFQICRDRQMQLRVPTPGLHLFDSRLEELAKRQRIDRMFDWACLQARVNSLYSYSRGKTVGTDPDEIFASAVDILEHLPRFPPGRVLVHRRLMTDNLYNGMLSNAKRKGRFGLSHDGWRS